MRLLVLTDQWWPDVVGGSARVAADTARGLAGRGHDVTVLAPEAPGLPARESRDGLELRRCVRRGSVPQTFGDAVAALRLTRREAGSFDLVLAHQATNAAGAALARAGAPLAYVFHASVPLEQKVVRARLPVGRRAARTVLQPAFVLLERVAVRSAARILVLSDFSRGLLLAAHPAAAGRVRRVSGGVDVERFAPVDAERREALRARFGAAGAPLLVTVRRLAPRMGLEELLRAARLLGERGQRFTLAVAGDGMLSGPLRALAAELAVDDSVRFLGRVPDRDLRDLYAAADLCVMPTVAYEGFGISTVEALASGCPVVGTAVGATPELLGPLDAGLVAGRAVPEEIAAAIEAAIPRLGEALRRRCSEYAHERFAWNRVVPAWEDALVDALDGGPRAA